MPRDVNSAMLAVDDLIGGGKPLIDCRRQRNNFEYRARLVQRRDGAIHARPPEWRQPCTQIGIERGLAGHGQNFAVRGVLHDHRTRHRVRLADSRA